MAVKALGLMLMSLPIVHRNEKEFLNLFQSLLNILLSSFDTKVNMQMIVLLPLILPTYH